MDLPSHPDAGDQAITPAQPGGAREKSWGLRIVIGVLAAIVAVVILLHLTGVVGPLAR